MTRLPSLTLLAALCTLLALTPAVQADEATPSDGKRAFEITDYYRTAFVSPPSLSPTDDRVAFSVRRFDFDAGKTWSNLWLMAPDGTGQRQMTHGEHNDYSPVFSPDGQQIVFTSDRSGESQLWSLPVDGGEPKQLTEFPPGVSDPVFSPDGKRIAVTAQVYPECGADAKCNRETAADDDEGQLDVHVADELLYRHWTSWREGRYAHILLVDAASGEVLRDLTPGEQDSPTFSLGGGRGYDFTADGEHLIYVSNHEPYAAESTNADLWRVAAGAEVPMTDEGPTPLTFDNKGWDGAPLISPDGRSVAYLSQETAGYEADLFRIAVQDLASGTTRYLTDRERFDDWATEIAWTPDSRSLVFQADKRGRTPLFRVSGFAGDAGSPVTIEEVLPDTYIDGWSLTADGRHVVYSSRSVGSPAEIYRAALDGEGAGVGERLTSFNAALAAEVGIRPAEELWVPGDGDYEVQVFLVKPHDFDPAKKYPVVLNVHGGPQSQWADAYRGDWQVYPGKGYIVAFPNPTGSPGRGQDFVDAIGCDWGGRVFRDLMKVTDALEELPYVDNERIGAMGWSYGGYMMMWFAGHTDRFTTLAAMMGVYDLPSMWGSTEELWFVEKDLCGTPWTSDSYTTWNPSASAGKFKTPTLVITGELDYRVPYTQSLQFFSALQKNRVPSRLVVFPRAGHWPGWREMAFYYNAHLDWFHRWLGGEPAPWDVEAMARNRAVEGWGKKGGDD